MKADKKAWFCYLPLTPEATDWGLHVIDAGFTVVDPGTPYPPVQHPDDHMFSWEQGRMLDSYTLVYIPRGGGTFESAQGGEASIKAGDLFILFPGERHRYRPDPETGWDEYWVEFDGEQARRIMGHAGFSARKPVVAVGLDAEIHRLFVEITEATEVQPPGFEHIIAAQTSQIVARVLAHVRYGIPADMEAEKSIRAARQHILGNAESKIDFAALAQQLGVSYSVFRRRFKQVTGIPPGQYQLQIRLKKARLLLRNSTLSVAEIADQLGFESVQYFSRHFKSKTGLPPAAFRKRSPAGRATPPG